MAKVTSPLKRGINPMPSGIRRKLTAEGLWKAYKSRPAYQQNDYIGWIMQAKMETTRDKRIHQMFDELKKGDVYMKMRWKGR